MPAGLYARTAARGFPAWDASGQSGQGALPDSTRAGTSLPGEPSGTWTDPNADPGSVPAQMGPPQEFVAGGLWGLSGEMNPDRTPRGHAAPLADPTLPVGEYFAEADATHAFDLGGPAERNPSYGTGAVGAITGMRLDHVTAEGGSGSNLQPLTGQIRANAGFDGFQGYGGGGDGPGGVNASMPLATDQRMYPGTLYDAYVSAAEVPFLTAETAQFIASAPEFGPWRGGLYDGPTASVRTQEIIATDIPAQGPPVSSALPAYATSFWG